jgi:hypothetical protein
MLRHAIAKSILPRSSTQLDIIARKAGNARRKTKEKRILQDKDA